MSESTKAIQGLKRASNYAKLTFREFGPKSYKKGQGALLKVVYKFGEDGTINKKTAEKVLGWCGKQLRHVAKKAQRNGYITIEDPEFLFKMTLTEKGTEVIKKRMSAEDRTADTILEALNAEEVQQLINITEKISKTCEGLGIDYSVIKERKGKCGKGSEKKHSHTHTHDDGTTHCHSHKHTGKHMHGHGEGPDGVSCERNGSKYVFIFK